MPKFSWLLRSATPSGFVACVAPSSWPIAAPFLMLLLANIFVSDPELHTGLVLYGLAPCIAMVIIFTYLAKGNTPSRVIGLQLGRTAGAVQSKPSKLHISLKPTNQSPYGSKKR